MSDKNPTGPATGRAIGGKARSEKLSPERRSEIARMGAEARKKKLPVKDGGMPKVLEGYAGAIDIGGVKLPCAVIDGPSGVQRVLTEHGITNAILGSRSGASKRLKKAAEDGGAHLPIFLAPGQLKSFINNDLLDGPLKPIDYLDGGRVVRAYDSSVLVAVCNVWLDARSAGKLQTQQLAKAQQAEALIRGLANVGIVALVDEATGYQQVRARDALQAYLEKFLRAELASYVARFPDEFFVQMYRLKRWPWTGSSRRPGVVGKYIRDLVYERLGPGVIEELERKNPSDGKGQRKARHHQWLSDDLGHPALSQHMHALIGFMRAEDDWRSFYQRFTRAFPKRGDSMPLL